jgi:hypothetical protein
MKNPENKVLQSESENDNNQKRQHDIMKLKIFLFEQQFHALLPFVLIFRLGVDLFINFG